jgi:iron complex outermembrane receptor protein
MKFFLKQIISLCISFLLFIHISLAQKGTVSGVVYGVEGGLQNASISVGSLTMQSNSLGKFSATLDVGSYTVDITHVGYKKSTQLINVEDGKTVLLIFNMTQDEITGEAVVLGSRSTSKSNLVTAVPVDVLSFRQLLQTSQTTLTQMLQYTVPSFNASRQLVNESVTLRGLDPDQVLILINGKRYHNMSFVNWGGVRGILGRGAVSNDLNAIPYSAIEKMEILKDGAAAQ